ncbi:LOW QUALITY PROTEIN: Protein CBG21826 [Caenorhabditis briggsae]|uniref:Protein CBG21826 n=1 Tax=Caenorhabditis briggsae TaxID=6238 RepID=E3CU90_CAEBR|nr:LOW QUALITY PROTEIN: Protein CBG21826 [Caenorhabditis briggsae]CBX32955.1 Protein CBG21826 [Caenorhabditis briggsae]
MFNFDISSISDNISRFCYVTTVFLNTLLIYLTMNHTKQIVGTYRNMIIIFASFGMWFATTNILLFHSYNRCLVYFTLGSAFRNKTSAEYELLLYSTMYGVIISFLAVQFIYRACVLSKPKWTKKFDGWKILIWILYVFIMGVVWSTGVDIAQPDEEIYQYTEREILVNYGVHVHNIPMFSILAYVKKCFLGKKEYVKCFRTLMVSSGGTLLLIVQYTICLVCGIIMYRRMQGSMSSFSCQHEKLQKQFFVALMYQVFQEGCLVFFHLPSLFIFILPFFDTKISFHSTVLIYSFNVYPLVDLLILLKVVSEYKIALKSLLIRFDRCERKMFRVSRYDSWRMGNDIPERWHPRTLDVCCQCEDVNLMIF